MVDVGIVAEGQQPQDRHIEIHRDVINSAIVSGDNNKVVIYHYHLDQQVQTAGKSSLPKLGANPYRGLAAFQVEDADVYFGREKEVDRLWNRLWNLYEQSQHDKLLPRLLPILGPSGSGKSSLARAGLLPELARRPLPGNKQTRVLIVKPGETPLEKLALILARIATGEPSPVGKTEEFKEVLEKRYEQGTNDGLSFIASILPEQDYPLVVLVDQFEEIYSPDANSKQRAAFVETLLEAAVTRRAQVSVVITLRSDFLGETQRHPKLNQIIGSDQSVFLPVMTRAELHLAIEKPAEQAGHSLDFATVDQLVEQTEGREGSLPLLQFALQRIWQELSDSNFSKPSKEILRDIGGVGGALAGEAERIYKSLNSQEQDIARRIFVGLAQIGEGTRYTRRRVEVDSLLTKQDKWEQVRKVLDRFSSPSTRLITLLSTDGEEVAEVTHEALFENWKQLKVWLDGKRDLLRQRDKIENAAKEWQQQGQKRGYLLQGRQLLNANQFRKKQSTQIPLSEKADYFIRKSLWQQRLIRLGLVSLLLVPTLILENYLREIKIDKHYASLNSENQYEVQQAILALTGGCYGNPQNDRDFILIFKYFTEHVIGNCRSLSGRNLNEVDLRYADLLSTDFSGANLNGANLQYATLGEAEFRYADLSNAVLRNANLSSANFSRANFSGANLREAKLYGAFLLYANFEGASLSSADLGPAYIEGANFNSSDLSYANFYSVQDASEQQFISAKLCRTELPGGMSLNPNRDCEELGIQMD